MPEFAYSNTTPRARSTPNIDVMKCGAAGVVVVVVVIVPDVRFLVNHCCYVIPRDIEPYTIDNNSQTTNNTRIKL